MPEAHAPGKLVICGEYAVLHGAPAIAVAVAVRARARVSKSAETACIAVADGGSWPFDWERGAPRWRQGPPPAGQGGILEAAAAAFTARGIALEGVEIGLDTRAFKAASGGKLGLGSSAAITVALIAALDAHARCTATVDDAALFDLCVDAHRRFQGGTGSGVDVAASVHGGVIRFTAKPGRGEVHPLRWPAGLHWVAAWSGSSASTTAMLARFDAFRVSDGLRFERHMRELRELATTAVGAWENGRVSSLLEALADYDDALRALDSGAGIGIYTPAHQHLAEIADAAGAVYKISGAGGGDFGIALADSPEVIARASSAFVEQGVLTIAGTTGAPGVRISEPPRSPSAAQATPR